MLGNYTLRKFYIVVSENGISVDGHTMFIDIQLEKWAWHQLHTYVALAVSGWKGMIGLCMFY